MNIQPYAGIVYKYRGLSKNKNPQNGKELSEFEKTTDIILNNRLWFSSTLSFNDPFDCSLDLIDFQVSEEYLFKNTAKNAFHNRRERKLISKDYQKRQEFSNYMRKSFDEDIKNWGVCSFSKNEDEILMWSHYAESHYGICFGFDPLYNDVVSESLRCMEVDYKVDFETKSWERDKENAITNLICCKSKKWEYEGEVRAFCEDPTGNFKNNIRFKYFNKNSLVKIIFGFKTELNAQNEIKRLVEENDYRNVNFFKPEKDKKSFKILIEPLR